MGGTDKFEWLNPLYSHKIRTDFDIDKQYVDSWRKCQTFYRQPVYDTFRGLGRFKVLGREDCDEFRSLITENSPELSDFYGRIRILAKIITDEIDDKIIAYFRSYYAPIWCRFHENLPEDPDRQPAFSWHCDAGPSKHLKLLVYLNSTQESGGTTLFLDRETTGKLEDIGYLFCPLEERLDDLSELAELYGFSIEPICLDLDAGDGILFEPSQLLHKGIWPTSAPRYMIQICFLPSSAPWRQACQKLQLPREDNSWPKIR